MIVTVLMTYKPLEHGLAFIDNRLCYNRTFFSELTHHRSLGNINGAILSYYIYVMMKTASVDTLLRKIFRV